MKKIIFLCFLLVNVFLYSQTVSYSSYQGNFSNSQEYGIGSFVIYNNSLFVSQVNNNSGNIPFNGSSYWKNVGSPESPVWKVSTNSEFMPAISAATTYTASTGIGSTIELSCGYFNLTSPIIEPEVSTGVNIRGCGMSQTFIQMSTQNNGSPWSAAIFRGQSTGIWGQFKLSDFTLDCSSNMIINALYGLNLAEVRGNGMILENLGVQNCGDATLGGEDILIGGLTNNDPAGIFMKNVFTDYHENIYAPTGQSIPPVGQTALYHPPTIGVEFGTGVGDSNVNDLVVRNAAQCPTYVDSTNTGDIIFTQAHTFGYGVYGSGSPYFNYASSYNYCDYSQDYSGQYDKYINVNADSPVKSGFEIATPNIIIDHPKFTWPAGVDWGSSNMFTLQSFTGGTSIVEMSHPACFNAPFFNKQGTPPNYISNQIGNPSPIIDGGINCEANGNYSAIGYQVIQSPLEINYDGNGSQYTLMLGTGSGETNTLSISGGRFQLGYYADTGASIMQAGLGKTYEFCNGNSFGEGCNWVFSPVFGFGQGGTDPELTPNLVLDLSGITAAISGTGLASATTISPINSLTEVLGTSVITTIVPPSPVCTSSQSCIIYLHSVDGFTLGIGGNLSLTLPMIVPSGTSVRLTYLPNLSQWSVNTGFIPSLLPEVTSVNGTNIPANSTLLTTSTVSLPNVTSVNSTSIPSNSTLLTNTTTLLPNVTSVNNTNIPSNSSLSTNLNIHDSNCLNSNGVACVKFFNQTGAISGNLFVVPTSGACSSSQYRLTVTLYIVSNPVTGVTIYANTNLPAPSGTIYSGANGSAATINSNYSGITSVFLNAGSTVLYSTTLSSGTTWPTYDIAYSLECLD